MSACVSILKSSLFGSVMPWSVLKDERDADVTKADVVVWIRLDQYSAEVRNTEQFFLRDGYGNDHDVALVDAEGSGAALCKTPDDAERNVS